MSPAAALLVQGVISLGPEVASFSGATAHVYLEDVSRADAAAPVVARDTIPNVAHEAGKKSSIDFRLDGGPIDSRAQYSVRVHIGLTANEGLHVGDYVSVQSYPVLTFGHPDRVTLQVKEIK